MGRLYSFQKMQHYVHGDISLTDYLEYLASKTQNGELIFPLYCNDAEVFDYRPGRFSNWVNGVELRNFWTQSHQTR